MIRVMVVDDHPLVLEGLRTAIAEAPDVELVNLTSTLAAARLALLGDPDIVICDIRLSDGSGFELLADAACGPRPPAFLMISSFDSPQYIHASQRLGAAGFLLKSSPTSEILEAVRRIAAGGSAYDVRLMQGREPWHALTGRERDVLTGVVAGRTNDEIAGDLRISRKTVEVYLSRMFARSGSLSRTELAVKAEREGWLDIPSSGS